MLREKEKILKQSMMEFYLLLALILGNLSIWTLKQTNFLGNFHKLWHDSD